MYRILIVDDLPIIVDGMANLLCYQLGVEVELYEAYSAYEALNIMNKMTIDIVLSDIKMPGMEGIELLSVIHTHWPACKVIFLTSYDDFGYAKSALSGGGFEYVLKTESDDMIVQAVQKAMAKLDSEQETSRLLEMAKRHTKQAGSVLRQALLKEVILGEYTSTLEVLSGRFRELQIDLSVEHPICLLLGRVDSWEGFPLTERKQIQDTVQAIMEKRFDDGIALTSFAYDESSLLGLFQLQEQTTAVQLDTQSLEELRQACLDSIGLSVSFLITQPPVSWLDAPKAFDAIRSMLLGKEEVCQIINWSDTLVGDSTCSNGDWGVAKLQSQKLNKIGVLGHYLERGDQDQFNQLFADIMSSPVGGNRKGLLKLEVYHGLASVFLSYLNVHPQVVSKLAPYGLEKLTHVDSSRTWEEIEHYFSGLAERLFQCREDPDSYEDRDVVHWINQYIDTHLMHDLSLARLAELVYLNPSYFSRLYKQSSGISISDYINLARINKSKELLLNSSHKIYEIAGMVGYDSRLSFVRFFKTHVHVTPQEFRGRKV